MAKLVSVIICSYRKFQFIYEAIDSVLFQSYGNIELLISDDGSDHFPEDELRRYIDTNKKKNITNVLINHEKSNLGTVKHLNHAVRLVNGDFIGILAADDAYFDEKVLERFVSGFEDAKEGCCVEMAQTAMCDHTLKRIDGYALFQNVREAAAHGGRELFELVAYCACLPTTSFFYKKEFFDRYGAFDEDFWLVEDYPMHCRIVREGWDIHYENFAAARHRSGGISHGNIGGLSKSAYLYDLDMLKIREKYVKPYYHLLGREALEDVKDKIWLEEKYIKSRLHLYENNKKLRRQYLWEYKWSVPKELLTRSIDRLNALTEGLWRAAFVLAVMVPALMRLVIQFSLIDEEMAKMLQTGAYRLLWIFLTAGVICYVLSRIGRTVVKIEGFPWDLLNY